MATSALKEFRTPAGLYAEGEAPGWLRAILTLSAEGVSRTGRPGRVSPPVKGEAHGFAGKLIRALQELSSYDRDHVRRHAEHLRSGGYVVAAFAGEDEHAKQRAADALRSAGGDFVNYYADACIESL